MRVYKPPYYHSGDFTAALKNSYTTQKRQINTQRLCDVFGVDVIMYLTAKDLGRVVNTMFSGLNLYYHYSMLEEDNVDFIVDKHLVFSKFKFPKTLHNFLVTSIPTIQVKNAIVSVSINTIYATPRFIINGEIKEVIEVNTEEAEDMYTKYIVGPKVFNELLT